MGFAEYSREQELFEVRHSFSAEVNPPKEELDGLIPEIIAHTYGEHFLHLDQGEQKEILQGFCDRLAEKGIKFSPPRLTAEYLNQAFTVDIQNAAVIAAAQGNVDIFVTMIDLSLGASVVLNSIIIAEEEAQEQSIAQDVVRYAENTYSHLDITKSADIFLAITNKTTTTVNLYKEDLTARTLVGEARKFANGEPSRLPGTLSGGCLISEAVAAGANWAADAYQSVYPLVPNAAL